MKTPPEQIDNNALEILERMEVISIDGRLWYPALPACHLLGYLRNTWGKINALPSRDCCNHNGQRMISKAGVIYLAIRSSLSSARLYGELLVDNILVHLDYPEPKYLIEWDPETSRERIVKSFSISVDSRNTPSRTRDLGIPVEEDGSDDFDELPSLRSAQQSSVIQDDKNLFNEGVMNYHIENARGRRRGGK